mmetsp:Transcript_26528/g.4641  ORF Transcript_26528/g.4641 Transcript_26528/m.4641 type:complete len:111 (+) Transcript_26528:5970-6302(+)
MNLEIYRKFSVGDSVDANFDFSTKIDAGSKFYYRAYDHSLVDPLKIQAANSFTSSSVTAAATSTIGSLTTGTNSDININSVPDTIGAGDYVLLFGTPDLDDNSANLGIFE